MDLAVKTNEPTIGQTDMEQTGDMAETLPKYHRYVLTFPKGVKMKDVKMTDVKMTKSEVISFMHKAQRNSKNEHICMLIDRFFEWVGEQREVYDRIAPGKWSTEGMPSTLKSAITHFLNRFLVTLFEEGLVLHFTREEQMAMVTSYCAAMNAREREDWKGVSDHLCEIQKMCIGYTRGRMGSLARAVGKTLVLHGKHVDMTESERVKARLFYNTYQRYERNKVFTGSKTALPLLETCLREKGFGHLLPLLKLKCAECAEVRRVMCMTALVANDIVCERPQHKLDTLPEQDTATLINSIPMLIEKLGVRDEHVTGKKHGRLPLFIKLGCRVSPETSMLLYGLEYKKLEEIYIAEKELDVQQQAANTTQQAPPVVASGNPKGSKKRPAPSDDKPTKKQSTLGLDGAGGVTGGPDWAGGVTRGLKSKIKRNGTNVFVAMVSPIVEGIRLSDAKGLSGPEETKQLLEVLIDRGMIATLDTNAFNLMRCKDLGILSVDENPMPGNAKLVVGDPRIWSGSPEITRRSSPKDQCDDSPFMQWLQTAQRMGAKFMIPVYEMARDQPEIIKNFLERFRDAYPRYKDVLQETYSQQERATIDERHRRIYSQFGVELVAGAPPPVALFDVQGEFEKYVEQVIPEDGIIDQQQLNLDKAVCHGFKNASLVGDISGPFGSTERIQAFIKIGEPAHSASFSKASAQLRRDLGLPSVPVCPVKVRVTDPEAFGPAATRGRDRHYA